MHCSLLVTKKKELPTNPQNPALRHPTQAFGHLRNRQTTHHYWLLVAVSIIWRLLLLHVDYFIFITMVTNKKKRKNVRRISPVKLSSTKKAKKTKLSVAATPPAVTQTQSPTSSPPPSVPTEITTPVAGIDVVQASPGTIAANSIRSPSKVIHKDVVEYVNYQIPLSANHFFAGWKIIKCLGWVAEGRILGVVCKQTFQEQALLF